MEIKRTWRRIQRGPWVTYLFLLVCVAMFIGTFGLTGTEPCFYWELNIILRLFLGMNGGG